MNEKGQSEVVEFSPRERRWINPHRTDAVYDLHGRREPRRLDLNLMLTAIPGFARQFRRVPARAVAEDGEDESGRFALVSCPCGSRPIVRDSLAKCSGCERFYALSASGRVFVTYGEMDPPTA